MAVQETLVDLAVLVVAEQVFLRLTKATQLMAHKVTMVELT